MYVVGIYVRKKKKQFMGEAVDAALEVHIFIYSACCFCRWGVLKEKV